VALPQWALNHSMSELLRLFSAAASHYSHSLLSPRPRDEFGEPDMCIWLIGSSVLVTVLLTIGDRMPQSRALVPYNKPANALHAALLRILQQREDEPLAKLGRKRHDDSDGEASLDSHRRRGRPLQFEELEQDLLPGRRGLHQRKSSVVVESLSSDDEEDEVNMAEADVAEADVQPLEVVPPRELNGSGVDDYVDLMEMDCA